MKKEFKNDIEKLVAMIKKTIKLEDYIGERYDTNICSSRDCIQFNVTEQEFKKLFPNMKIDEDYDFVRSKIECYVDVGGLRIFTLADSSHTEQVFRENNELRKKLNKYEEEKEKNNE